MRSVAVVGNKPLDPSPDRAAAIDACDLVVRVNGFRLDDDSDEPTYGRRAEVVFFNRALRATPWFFACSEQTWSSVGVSCGSSWWRACTPQ